MTGSTVAPGVINTYIETTGAILAGRDSFGVNALNIPIEYTRLGDVVTRQHCKGRVQLPSRRGRLLQRRESETKWRDWLSRRLSRCQQQVNPRSPLRPE